MKKNIKKLLFYISIVVIGTIIFSPKIKIVDSAKYYQQHKTEITDLLKDYNQLKKEQSFALGYLDNDYKRYEIHVLSDSVNYIYKSDVTENQIFEELKNNALTQEKLINIVQKLKNAKAIWIDQEDFYLSNKRQSATVLSFKAQVINTPFTPTRFYSLVILDNNEVFNLTDEELETYGLEPIVPGVYHTLSNQFR